jgi:2-dehydropantoate 2-reductase
MGTGGLGGYFGGLLARSGADVTFIARGANLQALQERGLMIRSVHGDFALAVRACADPAGLPAVDFVLFCVKTYDVAEATELLQPVVLAQTILLTLQNGVDTAAELQAKFQNSTVLAGITRTGSTLIAPGVIEQPTMDRAIELGSPVPGRYQEQVEQVRTLLAQADIPVAVVSGIQRSLWEKLVYISAFAGLSTLTGLSPNQILAQGPTRALYRTVMEETAAVARAAGVEVAPDIVEHTMQYLDAEGDLGSASMAVDFQRRQRIEIEAINGAIVRHGKRLGVPTPVNETIYAAVVVMDAYQRAAS